MVARDLFFNLFNISLETPLSEAADIIHHAVQQQLPEQVDEVYPYLGYLLDLPLDEHAMQRVKYLEGDALHRQIHEAVRLYITTLTAARPLVLTWDDLHWADPSSLHLLQALLPLTESHPLLLLLVYRPARKSRIWSFHTQLAEHLSEAHQIIELSPLTMLESNELAANLLGTHDQAEAVCEALTRKADGNPFFIEEVIRSLIERHLIAWNQKHGSWLPTGDIQDIEIPNTLQGVIMARVDQLDPQTKRILQIASVIGRNFSFGVLDRVLNQTRAA
jgi:predicted ATPase